MSETSFEWETPNDADLELFARELADFVPPQSFDAHAHLFDPALLGEPVPALCNRSDSPTGVLEWQRRVGSWMPDRAPTDGLFFPFPARQSDAAGQNRWLANELAERPGSRALMLIRPGDDPAAIERQLLADRFVGFKVYHVYADREDTFNAETSEFLPEWAWELANTHKLVIMLHLVLPRALAEPANQRYINESCQRFPNARLVLAHAARGFCGRHTAEGIAAIRGLDNVFFDTSGVCESEAFRAILRVFGPTRLFFATDFPVTELRTRAINLGSGFAWLNELVPRYEGWPLARPTLLGIESLLALRDACRGADLTAGDVEEIFCHAARELLGLKTSAERPDVQATYRHAKQVIPGGTQLLSKRPEMFAPEQWPAYYREARGVEVIDISGNRYVDMSLGGILACILGYADPDVNAAVRRRVEFGSMATLQTADEVALCDKLIEIHPWADSVRLSRSGGESMTIAVRLARAATGRDHVLVCGYHGWHDWYLAANLGGTDQLDGHLLPGLQPAGVPKGLAGTTGTFRYNRLDDLDAALAAHAGKVAAIVMEPTRHTPPQPGFLEAVRERADDAGIALIFDEISIGWRLCLGGAHRHFGVSPDMAVFAKSLSNGYAMGAVIGRGDVMQAAQDSFISSTYWTEGIGPAAALATVSKLQRLDVPAHLAQIGRAMMTAWTELGDRHGVPVTVRGPEQLPVMSIDHPDADALATLLIARMLRQGFLASTSFSPTYAHQLRHVVAYRQAAEPVFAELAEAIERGDAEARIGGPVKHRGFTRLT